MAFENRNPAAIEARGASENDLLAGGVNSEIKSFPSKNQARTAMEAAYLAALQKSGARS